MTPVFGQCNCTIFITAQNEVENVKICHHTDPKIIETVISQYQDIILEAETPDILDDFMQQTGAQHIQNYAISKVGEETYAVMNDPENMILIGKYFGLRSQADLMMALFMYKESQYKARDMFPEGQYDPGRNAANTQNSA